MPENVQAIERFIAKHPDRDTMHNDIDYVAKYRKGNGYDEGTLAPVGLRSRVKRRDSMDLKRQERERESIL